MFEKFKTLPRLTQAALVALASVATVNAQKPGTNQQRNAAGPDESGLARRQIDAVRRLDAPRIVERTVKAPLLRSGSAPVEDVVIISEEDISRGARLLYETNDASRAYAMPPNGCHIGCVHVHGAHSSLGMNRIDFGSWTFPFGPTGDSHSNLWWTIDATLSATPFATNAVLSAESGDIYAVPNLSRMWLAPGDGDERIVTWENFVRTADTNATESFQIVLKTNGDYETWSNEYGRAYARIDPDDYDGDGIPNWQDYSPTNSAAGVAGISGSLQASPVVMRRGDLGILTASFEPPASAGNAMATLSLTSGGDRVAIWTSTNRTELAVLPRTLSQGESVSFFIEGTNTSQIVGDVSFALDMSVDGDSLTLSRASTVVSVSWLTMTCPQSEGGMRPVLFPGEEDSAYSITNSLSPDQHLAVPFCNVATLSSNGFQVADFSVEMQLVLSPADLLPASGVEWEVASAYPSMSGSFSPAGILSAVFENPRQGGVYRFRARVGGSPWTAGTVVLPLAGASMDADFAADISTADGMAQQIEESFRITELSRPEQGKAWFYYNGMGDYRGRVDSSAARTIWQYNQVNDDTGFGAVATWHGVPVRMAKLSNFMVSYTALRAGVDWRYAWASTIFEGTLDDETAELSWNAGRTLAQSGSLSNVVETLVHDMWPVSHQKERRLWPNLEPADNRTNEVWEADYNFQYLPPGFILKANNTEN